jgi:hypothetical protein
VGTGPPREGTGKVSGTAPEIRKRCVGAGTQALMESYRDDDPSHAKGIFEAAIPNGVDAVHEPGAVERLTTVMAYGKDERILRIRGHRTTGRAPTRSAIGGSRRIRMRTRGQKGKRAPR